MTEDDSVEESLAALQQTSEILTDAVTAMSHRLTTTQKITDQLRTQQKLLGQQVETNRRQSTKNRLLFLSLFLDVALSVALAFGLIQLDDSNDEVSALQADLAARTAASDARICAQDALWIGLIEQNRKRGKDMTKEEKERLDAFSKVFEDDYIERDCAEKSANG